MDYKRDCQIKPAYILEGYLDFRMEVQNGKCFVLVERLSLCFHRNKKLWIPSKLMKTRLNGGDLLKILATDMKEETKKSYETGDI